MEAMLPLLALHVDADLVVERRPDDGGEHNSRDAETEIAASEPVSEQVVGVLSRGGPVVPVLH